MSMTFTTGVADDSRCLNVANGNFYSLCDALGYDVESLGWAGHIEPLDLLERINRLQRSLSTDRAREFERSTLESTGANGCRFIDCGLDAVRLNRYCIELTAIALAAIKFGSQVSYC